jgi:hypothetical protein
VPAQLVQSTLPAGQPVSAVVESVVAVASPPDVMAVPLHAQTETPIDTVNESQ